MQLSPHFSLVEFVQSDVAIRRNIDNTPSQGVIDNLRKVTEILEMARSKVNAPIEVTSGYRCLALNEIVGGAPNSAHLAGCAVDFKAPEFGTPLEICRLLRDSTILFDQMIYEYGNWVHLSVAKISDGGVNRRQILTKWPNQPYQTGIVLRNRV